MSITSTFLFINSGSFLFQLFLIISIFSSKIRKQTNSQEFIYLILLLGISILGNFYWIVRILNKLEIFSISRYTQVFLSRIIWSTSAFQYAILERFIKCITRKNFNSYIHYLQQIMGFGLSLFFAYIAFFHYQLISITDRSFYEVKTAQLIYVYVLFAGIYTISHILYTLHKKRLPLILFKQLKFVTFFLLIPYLFFILLTINPFTFNLSYLTHNYIIKSATTIIWTACLFACSRRLLGLRFLNIKKHVEPTQRLSFINDFKGVLEQLSQATTTTELKYITQNFFTQAFGIPSSRVTLVMRMPDIADQENQSSNLENFLTHTLQKNMQLAHDLLNKKIIICDEIEFTHYYEPTGLNETYISFSHAIHADIFLPVYQNEKIIGCIIVSEKARPNQLYTSAERDEMLVFTRYLGTIMHLMRHRNLDAMLVREKSLMEELYHKHQKINHYEESIRSFIRQSNERSIGIIIYKQNKFVMRNHAAQGMIATDPNTNKGHPFSIALQQIAKSAEQYKSTSSITVTDPQTDRTLVLSAVPSLERSNTIIIVYHPEIAETIKPHIDMLKDPSKWDYLLYLETTKSGQLINQLIPGTGEILLEYKINLLMAALSKKALFLEMPQSDIPETIDIIHHISLRKTLRTLHIEQPEKNHELAIKLFGINPLFEGTAHHESLLEKLHEVGTLYIKNIHLLCMDTQEELAYFLKYGMFHMFKSERLITSNVRIICSAHRDLGTLVEEGKFSSMLYNELGKMTIRMPSLTNLTPEEFNSLTQGIIEQLIKDTALQDFLSLTDKEKAWLIEQNPRSIHELRHTISDLLTKKSTRNKVTHEVLQPAYYDTDPKIKKAAQLGKEALKDKDLMAFLWETFKSQNKIAALLHVNRSSVNRRCRQYNLID